MRDPNLGRKQGAGPWQSVAGPWQSGAGPWQSGAGPWQSGAGPWRDGEQIVLSVASKPYNTLRVEVVSTPETLRKGLMGRKTLPPRYGMLFVFERETLQSMWMPNMKFPLDIVWLDANMKIVNISYWAEPCIEGGQCPSISSNYRAKYAIEMTAGGADAQGLAVGQFLITR
jgi:uncharacterized membrane protein (UPF0127 family)